MRFLIRKLINVVVSERLPFQVQRKSFSSWGSTKKHRKVPLYTFRVDTMSNPEVEKQLEPLRSAVKEQVT